MKIQTTEYSHTELSNNRAVSYRLTDIMAEKNPWAKPILSFGKYVLTKTQAQTEGEEVITNAQYHIIYRYYITLQTKRRSSQEEAFLSIIDELAK